jgi:hypothetical protein
VAVPATAGPLAAGLLAAVGLGLAFAAAGLRRRHRALKGTLGSLPVVRRLGRVTICACDRALVPYAARASGRSWVVVPTDLLDEGPRLRVLVAHEIQHHRQRDVQVGFCLEALEAAFFWNPAVPAWRRSLEELQELACDESLVARGRVDARGYGEILLHILRLDGRFRYVPQSVSAATGRSARAFTRRIEMLMDRATRPRRPRSHLAAGLGCLVLLTAGGLAARSAVREDGALTAEDARAAAESLARKGFPVPLNDIVVEELNTYARTPRWNDFLHASRDRLDRHREVVDAAFERHHLPAPLAAVAVVESGFASLDARASSRGAGVWQFIPETAKRYGLRVGDGLDERMDLERSTDAAARYLGSMYLQFQDWPLTLAAYNQGAGRVYQAMEEGGTRDAFALVRAGKLGRYAGSVIAVAILLEEPALLENK